MLTDGFLSLNFMQGELFKKDKVKYLIVDGHNFAYRAGLVSGFSLSTAEGADTTVVFAMLNMIRHQIDKHKPEEVCVCWDWQGSKIKEALYPEYKEDRKVAREKKDVYDPLAKNVYLDISKQIKELQEILPFFGIKQVRVQGVEADDVIGLLCEELKGKSLVVSSDKDLLQLVNIGAEVYYTPKDVLVTRDNFQELFGVTPELFIYYKAILGDASDCIEGLKGFGPKTSAKIVSKYGKWTNWVHINGGGLIKSGILGDLNIKQRAEICNEAGFIKKEAIDKLDRNYALMKAGYLIQDLKDFIVKEFSDQTTVFDSEQVEKYFADKQFGSFLARYQSWIMPFSMMAYEKTKRGI